MLRSIDVLRKISLRNQLLAGCFVFILAGLGYYYHPSSVFWVKLAIDKDNVMLNERGRKGYVVFMGFKNFSSKEDFKSQAVLFENDKNLGPSNALFERIAQKGLGRYMFWDGYLYFSSSDNSDPRENGRNYELAIPFQIPFFWHIVFSLLGFYILSRLAVFRGYFFIIEKRVIETLMRTSAQRRMILRKISLRYRHECFIISGIAVFWVIYLFSLNRNLLYLSLLWVIYIISSALFTRFSTMWVGLVVSVFLAVAPVNKLGVKFIDPAPYIETVNQGYVVHYALPSHLDYWQYVFQVDELEKHQIECGGNLQGRLVIDGLDLSGLEISIGGVSSVGSANKIMKMSVEEILLPIEVSSSGKVVVLLHVRTGTSPKIYLGPEAYGFDIYSDAVWLEFKNERCSVLYHAQRSVLPVRSGLYGNSLK